MDLLLASTEEQRAERWLNQSVTRRGVILNGAAVQAE